MTERVAELSHVLSDVEGRVGKGETNDCIHLLITDIPSDIIETIYCHNLQVLERIEIPSS